MKCIICGKELSKYQRKYCCPKCAQIAYITGKSSPKTNYENQVSNLWVYFKKSFCFVGQRFNPKQAWKARIFISACYELGYTPNSIARGLKKDHATILYHHKMASEEEKEIAREFLNNKKTYIYKEKKKPIRPAGFSY